MFVLKKITIVLALGWCTSAFAAENLKNFIAFNKLGDPQASITYHPADKKDFDSMITTLLLEAKNGKSESQVGLGMIYSTGYGVPQDIEAAEYWLNKVLAQGDQDAVMWLDALYEIEDVLIEGLRK